MNIKDKTIEETFAEEAVRELPEVKQMLVESAGIHAVLALSLADIYSSEAKRLKAKNAADPRGAIAKLRAGVATEKAKEIIAGLGGRKSPAPPAKKQPKKNENVIANPFGDTKGKESGRKGASTSKPAPTVKPPTEAAPNSKAASKRKAEPKKNSGPDAKPTAKMAASRKAGSKLK
jgi:hypothetical protein